jgi:4-amino-4-deoxy-L-arabinose transferase-like glycosyltransferase
MEIRKTDQRYFRQKLPGPVVTSTLLAVTAISLFVGWSRAVWWERLLLPPIEIEWSLQLDEPQEDSLYTGFEYPPYDETFDSVPVNAAWYRFSEGKPQWMVEQWPTMKIVGVGPQHPEVKHDRISLFGIMAPAGEVEGRPDFHPIPERLFPYLKRNRLSAEQWRIFYPDVTGNRRWVRALLDAGPDGYLVADPGKNAVLEMPFPPSDVYFVCLTSSTGTAFQCTFSNQSQIIDLYEPDVVLPQWSLLPLLFGFEEDAPKKFRDRIGGVDGIRFFPVVLSGQQQVQGRLLGLSVNGVPVELSSLAQQPAGADLVIEKEEDSRSLRFEVSGPDCGIQLDPNWLGRLGFRRVAAGLLGAFLTTLGLGAGLFLLVHFYRPGAVSEWPEKNFVRRRAGWLVLVVALFFHLTYGVMATPYVSYDGEEYLKMSENLAGYLGNGSFPYYRTPVYPMFIWLALWLGGHLKMLFLMQQLLAAGTAWLTWRLADRLGLGLWAVAAGLLVALNPIFHWYGQAVLSESLTMFCLVNSVNLLFAPPKRNAGWAFAGGFSFALLVLCRPQYLFLLPGPILLYFFMVQRPMKERIVLLLLMLAGVASLIAPWYGYNRWRSIRGIVSGGGYGLLTNQMNKHLRQECAVLEFPPLRVAADEFCTQTGLEEPGRDFVVASLYDGARRPELTDEVETVRGLHEQLRQNMQKMKKWALELYFRRPAEVIQRASGNLGRFSGLAEGRPRFLAVQVEIIRTGQDTFVEPNSVRGRSARWLARLYSHRRPWVTVLFVLGWLTALVRRRVDVFLLGGMALINIGLIALILTINIRYLWPVEPLLILVGVYFLSEVAGCCRRFALKG